MNVSACLVTRGDVDMTPITDSLTASGIEDIVIYDNSVREDLAVYGRYAAIAEAKHDFIWVQDDDCVLPPESINALLEAWDEMRALAEIEQSPDPSAFLAANMPQPFRHDFYSDHCLVGFGAVFHRDLPERAFDLFERECGLTTYLAKEPEFKRKRQGNVIVQSNSPHRKWERGRGWLTNQDFWRTCDVVFTGLTPRVLVDVPYENLSWAEDETRMYRSDGHQEERGRMLGLVRKVRDG